MKRVIRSPEEKVAIIKEAEEQGIVATSRRYGVYPSTIRDWRARYEREGIEGLKVKRSITPDPEVEQLRKENQMLKQLLADKELELKLKDALLKKVLQRGGR